LHKCVVVVVRLVVLDTVVVVVRLVVIDTVGVVLKMAYVFFLSKQY
jgi:hypothetical protein